MALPTHTQLHLDQMLAPPAAPARYFTTSPAPMTTEERDTSELDWSPPPRNRYHFSYAPPHPAPENDQEEDDPTESEELALVRTANASRLRRRGAIRIESDGHGGVGLSPSYSPYAHVPPPMLSERRRTVHAHADDVDGREEVATFELYCGGPVARDINPPSIQVQSPYSASTPYSTPKRRYVNPLPQPLPDSTPHHSIVPRTNGCGALVHISAVPSSKPGHWVAPISGATEDIAVLDGMYYDGREWLGKSPCGCVTEAAGCLTWLVLTLLTLIIPRAELY
ncbi:hypothetical protein BOTBODRAFT_318410 [Botryobasidium botryosum FD-172 SS1]|uniref:Uncharacterized protein n=1 Tax=Botryobasidium botryosum (strain FD-172 SS1) TaxID=930990 RepID=A0A067MYU4_BOTB1|nr:hypothetical protein BOTBODRAFT_318410 [Botryobasidium botryosum FD-172 SS1]